MKMNLISISANYPLEYYTNKNNIANQNFVNETIEYFETGHGARAYNPLNFLNLLEKQRQFVMLNFQDSNKVILHLNSLSLTELEKHILFGFILKWTGGYPVHNLDYDFDKTLKLVQKEFLNYEGDTPEKEFCKADFNERKKLMMISMALTTAINNNMDCEVILNAIEKEKSKIYPSFKELFRYAFDKGVFSKIKTETDYLINLTKYQYEFSVWLLETKNLEYGNENHFQTFLTEDVFFQFLNTTSNSELHPHSPSSRSFAKEVFNTFADAAIDNETLQAMFKILIEKKVINEDHSLIKKATLLYSLIKRFKRMGYFKKIYDKDLHSLVNKEFKIQITLQTYKQADCYNKSLT